MAEYRYQHGDRPLDGYTIERAVGRGGFGEVYYAVSDSGREVALKVVQNHQDIELRGISHCINLKSPYLVTIFDVKYNDANEPFVVMEYVAGPSLRQLLDESPAGVGTAKAAFFLREIAKGIGYLHDCGIVHRDLKPHNVFYEDGYVKIGDYGLSKAMSTSHRSAHTTTVGTVHYMAPEIGRGIYDRSIDIYALGAMLYEMLTGQPPYLGASPGEILMKHMSAEPEVEGIAEPFASVIKKAMAQDPADRYASVQEMVEDVFGSDHVRNSVSTFRPGDLSIVAEQVARKVAAGVDRPNRPTEEPATNLGDQIEHAVERLVEGVSHATTRAVQSAEKALGNSKPIPEAADARRTEPPAGVAIHDELNHRQRRHLAIITMVAVAIGTVLLDPVSRTSSDLLFSTLLVFLAVAGAATGLIKSRHVAQGMRHESTLFRHLTLGGVACLCLLLFALPMVMLTNAIRPDAMGPRYWFAVPYMHRTLIAICLPLFLLDWRAVMAPTRKERIAMAPVVGAAALAGVAAMIFGGVWLVAAGVMAGVALTVQVACPFDPSIRTREAARRRPPTGPHADAGTVNRPDQRPPAVPPPVVGAHAALPANISPHKRLVAMLLSLLPVLVIPVCGLHRFYVGRIGTGLLWFFTFGLLGIGTLIDIILIAVGQFKDSRGRRVVFWTKPSEIKAMPAAAGAAPAPPSFASDSAASRTLWQPTPASIELSLIGGLTLFAAVLLGMIVAMRLPDAAAAGLFDPAIRAGDLDRAFGYDQWPRLVGQIGLVLVVVLSFLSVFPLVIARRGGGIIHMLRAIVAVGGLLLGSVFLYTALEHTRWTTIAGLLREEKIGPAIEMYMNGLGTGTTPPFLIFAALTYMTSFLILAWPSRRRLALPPAPIEETQP